jgi:signal peptidase I
LRRSPGRVLVLVGLGLAVASVPLPLLVLPAIVMGILVLALHQRWIAGAVIVALPLLSAGLWLTLTKAYRIPSPAMLPTVDIGDRILIHRLGASSPERGDIVVFKPPSGASQPGQFGSVGAQCGVEHPPDQACPRPTPDKAAENFIKRVVAVPGDRIKIVRGRVHVDGRQDDTGSILPSEDCPVCNLPREITVPPGHFFVMGDNRGESSDSREWGPVPAESIEGTVWLRYWPLERFGSPE